MRIERDRQADRSGAAGGDDRDRHRRAVVKAARRLDDELVARRIRPRVEPVGRPVDGDRVHAHRGSPEWVDGGDEPTI